MTPARLEGRVVGVYASGGAPWHHLALATTHGASARPVRAEDIAAGALKQLDALIVPGGGATAMAGLLSPLGRVGARSIQDWVLNGGMYVSSCAGSVLPLVLADEAARALPTARYMRLVSARLANPGDATLGGLATPGVGRIRVRLDGDHRYAEGLPEISQWVHYNGPLFDLTRAPDTVRAFAWPVSATDSFTHAERFLVANGAEGGRPGGEGREASDARPCDGSFSPTTVFERCVEARAATALEAVVGHGRAVLFGSHPEFGLDRLLLGWGTASEVLVRALADARAPVGVGQVNGTSGGMGRAGWMVVRDNPDRSVGELASNAANDLRRIAERFDVLAASTPTAWLGPGRAASFHGRDARTAWREDTHVAAQVAVAAADDLVALAPWLDDDDVGWLDDRPRSGQDFGAMGLTQMLRRVLAMLDDAERRGHDAPRSPAHAYDLFDRHPFHLAVGSYLSAAGLTAAALLIVAVLGAREGRAAPAVTPWLWSSGGTADLAMIEGRK